MVLIRHDLHFQVVKNASFDYAFYYNQKHNQTRRFFVGYCAPRKGGVATQLSEADSGNTGLVS